MHKSIGNGSRAFNANNQEGKAKSERLVAVLNRVYTSPGTFAVTRHGRTRGTFSYSYSSVNRTLAQGSCYHSPWTTGGGGDRSSGAFPREVELVDVVLIRLLFVLIVGVVCFFIHPFNLSPNLDAALGLLIGVAIVVFEWRLRAMSLKRLIGAAIGSVLGIVGAYLFALVIRNSVSPSPTQSFLQIMVMLVMAYVGLAVGANKGDLINLAALGGVFGGEKSGKKSYKILDTSVIIDGRIADIAETGFLDGLLVIPQFVLRELQLVADSSDSLKRNRGRRGLDILQRLQKTAFGPDPDRGRRLPQRPRSRFEAHRTGQAV